MKAILKNLSPYFRPLTILGLFTFVAIGLVALRFGYTGRMRFLFLIWNLFLALMPLGFAVLLAAFSGNGLRFYKALPLLGLWLLFFPNAPYILTDIIHIRRHQNGQLLWYDLLIYLQFAIAGLLAGKLSLLIVHRYLLTKFNPWASGSIVVGLLILCAYGIFLGRFERWNSWDVFSDPAMVIDYHLALLDQKARLFRMAVLTGSVAAFLGLVYLSFIYVFRPIGSKGV